ncbi:MAG: polyvinylalcohol dehydrogenase, partial [Gemmataceae bacterium]|nr:polyvinylalcohol dehydrogenase [Gemmataceae bacterium]
MRRIFLTATFLSLTAALSFAADWPQWRGPERTGVSKETGLLKSWPEKGPKLLWTYKNAGLGFSSFAIVGDRLYTLGG